MGRTKSSEKSPRSSFGLRDKDLLLPDDQLTSAVLDDLWELFGAAIQEEMDAQIAFVKMVNLLRKPYRDHISVLQQGFASSSFFGPSRSSTCYTPSECTFADERPETPTPPKAESILIHQLQTDLAIAQEQLETKEACIQRNNAEICELRSQNKSLMNEAQNNKTYIQRNHAEISELRTQKQSLMNEAQNNKVALAKCNEELASAKHNRGRPIRVAIKSAAFRDRYVQMNGSGLHSTQPGGGGRVCVQTFIAEWETFELIYHDEPGVVSFKSITFDNVYLRADGGGLHAGSSPGWGGGSVNAQYGCSHWEKFRLKPVGKQGTFGIESVAFPGRYLRLDGNYYESINMQGVISGWEIFYLVVV